MRARLGGRNDRTAIAAIRNYEDANIGLELRPQNVQLVIYQIAVKEHPGLVQPVRLIVPVQLVDQLRPVARKGQQEEVAAVELRGCVLDLADHRGRRGLVVKQQRSLKSLNGGQREHVSRIALTTLQLFERVAILVRINEIQSDVE